MSAMTDADPRQRLIKATRRYRSLESAREEVEAAIVAALRAGIPPTEVAELSPLTDRRVRQIAREHGIEKGAPGRKPRTIR